MSHLPNGPGRWRLLAGLVGSLMVWSAAPAATVPAVTVSAAPHPTESGAAESGAAESRAAESRAAEAGAADGGAETATDDPVVRGRRLAGLAQCVACHTGGGDDAVPFAGGHAIQTSFGTFYGSNLTPDPVHGLGRWSDGDFLRAMREGRAPDGRRYWPAFPYGSYTGMTDSDILAIRSYLATLPPSTRANQPHRIKALYRPGVVRAFWQAKYLKPGPLKPDASKSASWNRGRYLAETVGHCGECHTPRTATGGLDTARAYFGAPYGMSGKLAPDLTPSEGALKAWEASDWETFLTSGMDEEGDTVGGHMYRIVEEGTAQLSEADRAALAEYFRQLPAHPPHR